MGGLTWTKRSFSKGEIAPHISQSRTDLPFYAQCISHSRNVIPLKTGALIHRPNTVLYPDILLSKNSCRIIPFYIAEDTHVLLVFGENEITFILIEGGAHPIITARVAADYSKIDAIELDYAVKGRTMVLTHRYHPPHQIIIEAKDRYTFSPMPFSSPPWLGERLIDGVRCDVNLTVKQEVKDISKIISYKAVASSPIFKGSDKGRFLRLGLLPGKWYKRTFYEKNSYISQFGKVYLCTKAGTSGEEWDADVTSTFVTDGSLRWKVVYVSPMMMSEPRDGKTSPSKIETRASGVVPKFYIFGQITAVYGDRDNLGATVDIEFSSPVTLVNEQETDSWSFSAWGDNEQGYPSHVTFYQNRLVFSGGVRDATSFYLSAWEDFESFSPDGDYGKVDYLKALSFAITDDTVKEIRWITPMSQGLLIGCDSSLWFFCIDLERGVNAILRKLSGDGVYSCPPVVAGDSLLFVCGSGRSVKAVSGSFEQGFRFKNLTQFVDHLFDYRIKQLVYQGEPYSLIWAVDCSTDISKECISLYGCRFSPEEEDDFAWHTHTLLNSGIVSMATFASVDRGQTDLWLLVFHTSGNAPSTLSLERLERFKSDSNYYADRGVVAREAL